MSTFYIKNEQKYEGNILIEGQDAKHIKNVLRYKVGDKIDVCDESGVRYETLLEKFEDDKVLLKIVLKKEFEQESSISITLFQGLPKGEKMDLIVQKATELGVDEIVPVEMERSIVKLDAKSAQRKVDRWNKIAYEASKQSGRQFVPKVSNVDILKNIIEKFSKYDIVVLPYEKENKQNLKQLLAKNKNVKNVAIVIGPEGGFSDNDLALLNISNVHSVTLGSRILRTETAGIAVLSMLLYEFEF